METTSSLIRRILTTTSTTSTIEPITLRHRRSEIFMQPTAMSTAIAKYLVSQQFCGSYRLAQRRRWSSYSARMCGPCVGLSSKNLEQQLNDFALTSFEPSWLLCRSSDALSVWRKAEYIRSISITRPYKRWAQTDRCRQRHHVQNVILPSGTAKLANGISSRLNSVHFRSRSLIYPVR